MCFCNKEEIITGFIYEDEKVMAFMDMDPINEGHVLIVTKEHYLDIDEIPDDILAHLIIISKKIVSVLKEIYNPDGYSIMQNGGKILMILDISICIFSRDMKMMVLDGRIVIIVKM